MSTRRVAEKLIAAKTLRDRRRIAAGIASKDAPLVARDLRAICYEIWTTDPIKARRTSDALESVARNFPEPEILANSNWTSGIAAIAAGRFESAAKSLDDAALIFRRLGNHSEAANTQVAKLIALALLGRYDDALKTGRGALKTFVAIGDDLAAGKIEMNLSNIVSRREKHRDAERFCRSALDRFKKCGAKTWEAMALNGLANTYAEQNDFRKAEDHYRQALGIARAEGMIVTEAEIEASMGNLAIFRGRFDEALRLLELSRQKYAELRMPHQSAIAELEIAEIYAELNLDAESEEIFARNLARLRRLGLHAEEARAAAGLGRAAFRRGNIGKARRALARAAELFATERNRGGEAAVLIAGAELELARGNPKAALTIARTASAILAKSENRRLHRTAEWVRAETLRAAGFGARARKTLEAILQSASADHQSTLVQACLGSLGEIAFDSGDLDRAEDLFERSAELIESMRAPLPAEEFRMSFLADKLSPYENIARIRIRRGDFESALESVERSKARTLSETASPASGGGPQNERHEHLREELNWYFSRLGRASADESKRIETEIRRREREIAELERQISAARGKAGRSGTAFDLKRFRRTLGPNRALVEFVRFGESYSAFVLSDASISYFPDLVTEAELLALLEGLQFQFGALRYGTAGIGRFLESLKSRADAYLGKLYERLIAPLAASIAGRELIIVPAGALNYIPFPALRGERYLVEDHEISYAPSAAVAERLMAGDSNAIGKALLIGFADEKIPLVDDEIRSISTAMPNARVLTGSDATFGNFREFAGGNDALHIACHGQFRPDNPMFSSLHLADGVVTVRDVCAQRIDARVVTLSACETGLSKVFAGDEILGLARGFLTAGARSLVLSLWTVNDQATARLMTDFYSNLQRGGSVAASLRKAQLGFVRENAHPYLWAPFIAIGK